MRLAPIPARFKKECARPVLVAEKADYSVGEILTGWTVDAESLDTCGKRQRALVGAIDARDAAQGAQ